MITDISTAIAVARQRMTDQTSANAKPSTPNPELLQGAFDAMAQEKKKSTPEPSAIPLVVTLPFLRHLNDTSFTTFQANAAQVRDRAENAPISTKGFLLNLGSHFTQKAIVRESSRRLNSLKQRHSGPKSEATLG